MSSRYIKIIAATLAIALVVALIFVVRGYNDDTVTTIDTVLSAEESANKILQQPAAFDQRTLDEYAEAIHSNEEISVEDISLMIVAVEATLNKFGQELEFLASNNDVADSWNTMKENAKQSWPRNAKVIIDFLQNRANLSNDQIPRMQAIVENSKRYEALIRDIEVRQLNGESTGLSIIQ